MVFMEDEVCWGGILFWRNFQRFSYSSTAMNLGDKWRSPFDLAYSKGAETTFQGMLIVGGDGDGGG